MIALGPSGHVDTFTRDNLPPFEEWPDLLVDGYDYPEWLNCAHELTDRMVEVQERYRDGLAGRMLEAKPKSEGDGAEVRRNEHHIRAVGIGDPQIYAG